MGWDAVWLCLVMFSWHVHKRIIAAQWCCVVVSQFKSRVFNSHHTRVRLFPTCACHDIVIRVYVLCLCVMCYVLCMFMTHNIYVCVGNETILTLPKGKKVDPTITTLNTLLQQHTDNHTQHKICGMFSCEFLFLSVLRQSLDLTQHRLELGECECVSECVCVCVCVYICVFCVVLCVYVCCVCTRVSLCVCELCELRVCVYFGKCCILMTVVVHVQIGANYIHNNAITT